MSSSSTDINTTVPWSSNHVAEKLIEMYEKSLPILLAPTISYAIRSSSSSSSPFISIDILPEDIMYTSFGQTVTLGLELCTIQGLYNDVDSENADYFGGVHMNILMNICNRLGLEVEKDVLQSYKDAIWDLIEELQSSDALSVLFHRCLEHFLFRLKALTKDTVLRQECIKSFRIFLKQDTVMEQLVNLNEKTFAKVYKVFQLYNTDGRFSVKLGSRLTVEKVDTARAILAEYLLDTPVSTTSSGTNTISTRSNGTTTTSGGNTRRVSIQDLGENTDENDTNSKTDNSMIIQMKKQIDLLTSMLGNGQTFQSNNNSFSSIIESVQATTPQRSPTRSGRNRGSTVTAVPTVTVSTNATQHTINGAATSNTNKNNSLFNQLQYMSSTGTGKAIDSDSEDDDGEYGDSASGAFGGNSGVNRRSAGPSGGSSTGTGTGSGISMGGGNIHDHDNNSDGTFDTNLYMNGCLVCEESFASILQKEVRSYASHEQYYRQELMNKINSKQISYEIGRLVMICDALHGIGIGNNVPSIFTKHHIYEIISRIIVGLQIADQNGTYDTLEGLIGQQKFALPVSIIAQLNKARLQGKKLESRKVLDTSSSSSSSSSSGTYNRMNQNHKTNNTFSYNSFRGGRGGSGTHRGGGNVAHHANQRGGTGGAGITNSQ